jgi:ketosteroid isomerase-like protein
MRHLSHLAFPILLSVPVGAQTPADSLRALDSAWARTYATHDTALAAALLGDHLVVTATDGRLKDKAVEIEDVRPTPGLRMHHFRTSEVRINVYSGAGVVTGLVDWAFTYKGRQSAIRRRYTALYVRGGSLGWQLVALHIGRAPEPTPPH